MNSLYAAGSLAGAWELMCYFFTMLGVALSFLTSLR
jgi:hypothetical protein